ncbi:MAG: PadR family transcriptional regulator [Erysipelotrichaceae bacterium]|nr:PadR family transcriptional regulator [Erysipelotrichaceae bacterium]MCI9313259.1 PadR family transcriptional regulator [Erysipelotrichaceae bacterium]
MPLKHAILGFLNYQDMSGYDIDRWLEKPIAFFWHAQTSQVYKELNAMMKNHWVESRVEVQSGKPNKKVFSITDEGRIELVRWLGDADLGEIMKYKNPLLIKVFFSSSIDLGATMRMLEKYIAECNERIEAMNEDTRNIPSYEEEFKTQDDAFYWGMTMTYGLMHYQNEIKWANWCIDKLKDRIDD